MTCFRCCFAAFIIAYSSANAESLIQPDESSFLNSSVVTNTFFDEDEGVKSTGLRLTSVGDYSLNESVIASVWQISNSRSHPQFVNLVTTDGDWDQFIEVPADSKVFVSSPHLETTHYLVLDGERIDTKAPNKHMTFQSMSTMTAESSFLEADGLLIMEAESTLSDLGKWQKSTSVANYTGSGFLEFDGNGFRSGSANSPLTYTFTIQNEGTYRFIPRAASTRPSGTPDDQGNDMFVKMEGDFTSGGNADLADLKKNQKFFTILKNANRWVWGERFDINNSHTFRDGDYYFKSGETYKLTISGRSKSYSLDRLVFYKKSEYSENEATQITLPESPRSGIPEGSNEGPSVEIKLDATADFEDIKDGEIPYYVDNRNDALGIDASKTNRRGPFARATTTFTGESGTYDVTLTTMTEEDGESTYHLLINDERVASYQNPYIGPGSSLDIQPHQVTWQDIQVNVNDVISIESNAHTNGEISEGNGTAWARGRWQELVFTNKNSGGEDNNGGGSTVVENALSGQIMVDPEHGNYLVRNQDLNNDGKLDPFMMAGVGGPEQFLYLGDRQTDGTRQGGRQQHIIDQLIASGANGIYIQAIRTFGGDARFDDDKTTQAPFNDPLDPDSGLNRDIMEQWHGWFEQFRDNNIAILFFIYDDHAKPWGSDGDSVPKGEQDFLTAITDEFEQYPNIMFVMAEEFRFAGFSNQRMSNMAAVVAQAMDYPHVLGVHHNIGLANQFANDPNINAFVQQADLRPNGNKMELLHKDFGTEQGFDEQGRFAYIMGEGFGYHQDLIGRSNKRDELRQSLYATAMAGGITTVFGAYESAWGRDPSTENLEDMGRLVEFFHTTPFNTMDHNDSLAFGDTDWVKADVGSRYLTYSRTAPSEMGVKGLPEGNYTLRWFNAKSGQYITQNSVPTAGDTAFSAPKEMNSDTVLEIIRVNDNSEDDPVNTAPSVYAGADQQVSSDVSNVTLDATVSDDGLPASNLSYSWTQISGPDATILSPDSEDTDVLLSESGSFVLQLTVSDGALSASDDVRIIREQEDTGRAPVAVIDPVETAIDNDNNGFETIALSQSSTADNDIVTYEWYVAGMLEGTGPALTYDFSVGATEVSLTVTDSASLSSSASVIVTVESPESDAFPTAVIDEVSTVADSDGDGVEQVTVTQSSTDDNGIVSYDWSINNLSVGTASSLTYEFPVGVTDVTLTVTDISGQSHKATTSVRVTTSTLPGEVVYAINAGGGDYLASDGTLYEADNYALTGKQYVRNRSIAGTDDDEMFSSERYIRGPGALEYAFPIANGTYEVTLMWSENTARKQRIMDVYTEGQLAIDALDVAALAGGKTTAYAETLEVVVRDGALNLRIVLDETATEQFPNIMAIRVVNVSNANDDSPTAIIDDVTAVADSNGDGVEQVTVTQSSTDDNGIVSYDWSINNLSVGTASSLTYEFPVGVTDVTLTVTDIIGQSHQATTSVLVTASTVPGEVVYAINAGGSDYLASDGTLYEADNYALTGKQYVRNRSIAGTDDDEMFSSERYIRGPGALEYAFPIANGTYEVTLMWSENTARKQRIMDVYTEGQLAIDALDVAALAGGKTTAYAETLEVVVRDGALNLRIVLDETATEQFPNIMAIRIE